MNVCLVIPFVLAASACAILADGPADNLPDKVRRIPPPGIAIPEADRAELETGAAQLGRELDSLRAALPSKPALLDLLSDAQIYHKAVHDALAYGEIYRTNDLQAARLLLQQGMERAKALRDGQAPWATATGLVVRAYVSKIDGSLQPYGLVVPPSYRSNPAQPHRLDAWFHGRNETLTELSFINERQRSPGEFVPPNSFVLHLYGRYCNANKFAGEIDLFEALDHVRRHYPIDENRLVVRGFSMGGAACWQFAVHYAGLWAAAAPGAGFSETPDFLKVFQNETIQPTWFEQKLWHWYDCTDYAANLFNCPTVAYSGEIDRQKQAADMMAKAMASEGMELTHIIGSNTAHRYHPQSKEEINRRIDGIVARGRNPVPNKVRFTTWTLRYHRMHWVTLDGLDEHWERARLDAEIVDDHTVAVKSANVAAFTVEMPAGLCPLEVSRQPKVVIDGRELEAPSVSSDRSWAAHFVKSDGRWTTATTAATGGLRKIHGLQGPIDDAFLDSFLMVRPTGKPLSPKVGAWAEAEHAHAVEHWRRQFRGQARVKADVDVTEADIADHHLVLWGDPQSNALLAKIAPQLPIRWDAAGVHLGGKSNSAEHHVLVLIYPNPLNPNRYVVLNSGFTFREYDYLNNARQVPKLPDYAVVDINVPVSSRGPGGIAAAGFFGERWELKPSP
ncbi:MAG: prolyl oligopeptidase family serine peptidase [Verrucomicrobia bacterium]|nr:prolyl oligopeptidase family serine peptidase [Verrucomicrobiota bacterium]